MRPVKPLKASVVTAIGIVICAWSAALLCLLFHGHRIGTAVPIGFLGIVTLVAMRCGLTAGLIGSTVAALIFAVFLYQPLGSVAVASPGARMNLAWLILGGLAFSYLLAPGPGGTGTQRHQ
jgi:K+-sensing histidine kinase KdpD